MNEFIVEPSREGERLDRAVAELLGLPRGRAAALVDDGSVRIDGSPVTQRSRRVRSGECLAVDVPVPTAAATNDPVGPIEPVPIRFEDEHLLIVAKPAGLVVHPAPGHRGTTLVDSLRHLDPPPAGGDPERPGIVHRLDRDTSGLLLVARSEAVHAALSAMLQAREITRVYEALVDGPIEQDSLTIDAPVGRDPRNRTRMAVVAEGRDAVTDLDVRERFDDATRIHATLRTGRTHQIRVHLSAVDHPVSGDATYGADAKFARSIGLERPFLHATHLRLLHPVTGRALVIDEPLPEDLVRCLTKARVRHERGLGEDPGIPPHRRAGTADHEF